MKKLLSILFIAASCFGQQLANNLAVKQTAGAVGSVCFYALDNTNCVGFVAPNTLSAITKWILPAADGTAGQVLKTDGAKNLSWTSAAGAGILTSFQGRTTPAAVITSADVSTGLTVAAGVIFNAGVTSFNGRTGTVTLSASDVTTVVASPGLAGNIAFQADNAYNVGGPSLSPAVTYSHSFTGDSLILPASSGPGNGQVDWGGSVTARSYATNDLGFFNSSGNLIMKLDSTSPGTQGLGMFTGFIRIDSTIGGASALPALQVDGYVGGGQVADLVQVNSATGGTVYFRIAASGQATAYAGLTFGSSSNSYLRTFSGAPSCTGVTDGWFGYDSTNDHFYICQGGAAKIH